MGCAVFWNKHTQHWILRKIKQNTLAIWRSTIECLILSSITWKSNCAIINEQGWITSQHHRFNPSWVNSFNYLRWHAPGSLGTWLSRRCRPWSWSSPRDSTTALFYWSWAFKTNATYFSLIDHQLQVGVRLWHFVVEVFDGGWRPMIIP